MAKKKSSSAGDSSSLYIGSQPAPKISVPSGPPQQVGGLITGPSTGSVRDMVDAVTRYSSGGTSSNNASIERARQEAESSRVQAEVRARFEAQQKAQAEALRIQQEQARQEQIRIENLRGAILQKGAQERARISKNAEGQRIRQTTTEIRRIDKGKSTNALVWKYENLDTGEVRYRSYEGAGRRNIGGVDFAQQSSKQVQEIKNELTEAGLKPIVSNGQVVGFSSPDTQKSYSYSDSGFKAYERESKSGGAMLLRNAREQTEYNKNYGMSILPDKIGATPLYKLLKPSEIKNYFGNADKTKQTIKNVASYVWDVQKNVPKVLIDFALSIGKGVVKTGLYAIDLNNFTRAIRYDFKNRKFYIPSGTKAITDKLGNVKKWVDYDYKREPFKDPDYQAFGVTTAMSLLGLTAPAIAVKIFGAVKGKAIYDAIKNPTPYNMAVVESLFLPGLVKRGKKLIARRDILTAKTGELVPLKERIKQVDFVNRNAGRTIETITSKPSSKAKFTNVLNKNNPDYTYGKKIEFATYKVGKAYPTSEYFLKGKGTKLQQLLKTGRVNIERVIVAIANKKYGKYIKSTLLKKGRVPEAFIKKYYAEVQAQANRIGRPVVAISPKRLRGFWQAEQEIIKILPNKYSPKKLKFAGFTEDGYRVFSDEGRASSFGRFVKSKFTKGKIERSYFKELAKDKLQYLKGRKAIKGEYAEHGRGHLTANNVDPYAQRYARNMNVKKYGNVFKQHDLAKVSDQDSFAQFEHGKVLYNLWKKGQYPDRNIYKLPRALQRQIAEAYAGHTPVKPRLIDTLIKGWKDNSITKDLVWWLRNKRNPYLQDVLTLDRIELPRAGRWNFKVKYNLLSPNSLRRIYGSELNAIKNIRFLDWRTVPSRLIKQLGRKNFNAIKLRDSRIFKILKRTASKTKGQNFGWGSGRRITAYKPSRISTLKKIPYQTSNYKRIKGTSYKMAYKRGYESAYKIGKGRPITYKRSYGKYQKAYNLGYKDGYRGNYKITPQGYTPSKGYKPSGKYTAKSYVKGRGYKGGYGIKRTKTTQKPERQLRPVQGFRPQQLSRAVATFYVVEKVRGKFRKLYPKPLTLRDARDYAVYSIDNNLSRTAFFIPLGRAKRVVRPPKQIQNYASRNSFKVRPYRIRYGRKRRLVNGYIEKRRFFQDTSGERGALRRLRRVSPARRRQLIKQLQKARMKRFGRRIPNRQVRRNPQRQMPRRRMSAQRRRQLILQLKRARAMRFGNRRVQRTRPMRRQVVRRSVRRSRRISPQQRRVLIARLRKARAVRMANLRRRR